MTSDELQGLIEAGLDGATAKIEGEGDHFKANVICAAFAGKTPVQQHQMVYATLGDLMQGEIHALALSTFTPEQWEQRPDQ